MHLKLWSAMSDYIARYGVFLHNPNGILDDAPFIYWD